MTKLVLGMALGLTFVVGMGAEPRWYAPGQLKVGMVNEVYEWDDGPLVPFSVEVIRPGARRPLATAPSLAETQPVLGDQGQWWHWSGALVCLDTLDNPGPVIVRFVGRDGSVLAKVPAVIVPFNFSTEEIPLDKTMSQLRQTNDARKDREWEAIWAIYSRFDPDFPWYAGTFTCPVPLDTRLSAHFGDLRKYLYSDGQTSVDYHRGVDFAVPVGTPVLAPARGRVALVADRLLTGTSIVLEHGPGVYSVYFHLSRALVQEGDRVTPGARIALSGASGLVTGPHLHWEFRINGVSVDPLPVVSAGILDTARAQKVFSSFERPIH